MITITKQLKEENPITAWFCEIINEALKNSPNMSLAEFAEQLDEAQKETAFKRLSAVVAEQIKKLGGKNDNKA